MGQERLSDKVLPASRYGHYSGLEGVHPALLRKIEAVIADVNSKGFDIEPFETVRSKAKQKILYSIGRTTEVTRKPVTWTLSSNHIQRYFKNLGGWYCTAVDFWSVKNGWNWSKELKRAFASSAKAHNLKQLSKEICHLELRPSDY